MVALAGVEIETDQRVAFILGERQSNFPCGIINIAGMGFQFCDQPVMALALLVSRSPLLAASSIRPRCIAHNPIWRLARIPRVV